jgi:Zn-dependent M16 (insulinase) family peptidase
VLDALESIRRQMLRTANARMFVIGSAATQQSLAPAIENLIARLDQTAPVKAVYGSNPRVLDRLREREPEAASPLFVGLLNPNSQGGVFLNSAPGTAFEDTDRERLLDVLAGYLYGGGGGHSIFMKTVGAGMAYSNGIGTRLAQGRTYYYAERTPDLPSTLKFVIEEIQKADYDPALVEYAVAQAFTGTRSASSYEARGEAIAANLADGLTPEVVARFHREILKLRNEPDIARELFRRMPAVYSRVLPGMGGSKASVTNGIYFVIGPEKQLAAWEAYLKSVEGDSARLYQLYPRDFWM